MAHSVLVFGRGIILPTLPICNYYTKPQWGVFNTRRGGGFNIRERGLVVVRRKQEQNLGSQWNPKCLTVEWLPLMESSAKKALV